MKELPKMYQNKINKDIKNRQEVYSSLTKNDERTMPKKLNDDFYNHYTIEQKIYNIFNSRDYIYKADVTIVTDKGTTEKRIVGKNKTNLITIDNEYIPISTIRDIYKN
jgi:hypothetical protein